MAQYRNPKTLILPPGLSKLSAAITLQLDLKKKRVYKFVLANDSSASTISMSNSQSKEQTDNLGFPVQAEGESSLSNQQDVLTSSSSPNLSYIAKFYGDFLLSKEKYIGSSPARSSSSEIQVLPTDRATSNKYIHGHSSLSASCHQNIAQNRQKHENLAAMCTERTTHSDNDFSNEFITWEDFQSEKQRQEQEIKLSKSAAIVKENEKLLLGPLSSGSVEESCSSTEFEYGQLSGEVDLLEFSPVIAPMSTAGTSASESSKEPEVFSLDYHAFKIEADSQNNNTVKDLEPTYLLQTPTNLSGSIRIPTSDSPENRFGNMVLQGLGDRRPLSKGTPARNSSLTECPSAPRLDHEKKLGNGSCSESEDLIEL